MGFWQSKMRYRTSDELVDVAQGFADRHIPLDVLVVDFYSWSKFGDFHFDYKCWPNASEMVTMVHSLGNGTKVLHSTYPWVDDTSENYQEFLAKGFFATYAGTATPAKCSPAPGGAMLDPFLPGARALIWEKVKAGYFDAGIDMFWLDDTEPNVRTAGLEYGCGIAEHCGALWSNRWIESFTEGSVATDAISA
jgi:alpha-D-xyloside xylohydrolase